MLGLMANSYGHSCVHNHCCGSTGKVGSLIFFYWCAVLDKVLKELEDAIQVTVDHDLHPQSQRCRVGYLSWRIAHDMFETINYVDHIAVISY
jgi:hypothetical protein